LPPAFSAKTTPSATLSTAETSGYPCRSTFSRWLLVGAIRHHVVKRLLHGGPELGITLADGDPDVDVVAIDVEADDLVAFVNEAERRIGATIGKLEFAG
jgi:hypothetical protein